MIGLAIDQDEAQLIREALLESIESGRQQALACEAARFGLQSEFASVLRARNARMALLLARVTSATGQEPQQVGEEWYVRN